jgi:SAM-dependent methyltransferase
LNETVWREFSRSLQPGQVDRPLRLLEAGAGIGGMIERLLERLDLGSAEYFALDSDPAHPPEAARRLQAWLAPRGGTWQTLDNDYWRVEVGTARVNIHWATASLFDETFPDGPFDVLLAHAFLDLVDLDRALPRLLSRLRPGGLFYFSLNFDGLTAFLPELDPPLDQSIIAAYHATMDARRDGIHPSGDSRTGRRLLTELPRHGAEVLAAGASDWIVFPRQGKYPAGEEVFLNGILDSVEDSLHASPAVPADQLSRWSSRRRRQVQDGELVYLAHQLDVLGRKPG